MRMKLIIGSFTTRICDVCIKTVNLMEIRPVKQSKKLGYPILECYIENPNMLSRNIPDRWIKNKYVSASLSAFNFSCADCSF